MRICLNDATGYNILNKVKLGVRNGSKILGASTSASAVRGMSFNILFLDEFACSNYIAESFFASVYPTITSGKNTKVIMVSTPHGDESLLQILARCRDNKK